MLRYFFYFIIAVFSILILAILIPAKPVLEAKYIIQEVKIPSTGETLYFKQKTWGVANSSVINSLSKSQKETINEKEDICYNWGETFFYQTKDDTLTILTMELAHKPISFNTVAIISQIKIEDNQRFNELLDTYKDKGFHKFPATKDSK